MADYSKWKHLDDGDPEPEDLPTPEQQRAGRHPEDAGSAEANSGSTEKKGKKHRRNTPKTTRVESAYVPSFGGQAGRFILLRVLPRFNPMLTPEDEARIVQALKQVDGVHDAKVDTKTKTATITGPRGVFSKNPATAKLLKAVEAAGLPGCDESVTMLDAEGKRAAAAAAECAGGHAMLQHIESRLGMCCFWCWLAVGTAVGASAMGLQQPCTWCLQTVHAVDLRELSCEVLCGDRSRVLWTRWNPVSVVVCGLESAGYVEIFAMMFCAHTPSTIFDSSASFDTPCASKMVTRGFFLHTYSRRVIFICLFYRLWGCFGTVDGATNQSIIGRFMRVYSRISMCLLVFPETDNIFMLHFVLLMWSTSELTRCASFTMPSHLTEGLRDVCPVATFPIVVMAECWICYKLLLHLTAKTLDPDGNKLPYFEPGGEPTYTKGEVIASDDGAKLFTILHMMLNSFALVQVYPAIWSKAEHVLNKSKQD